MKRTTARIITERATGLEVSISGENDMSLQMNDDEGVDESYKPMLRYTIEVIVFAFILYLIVKFLGM